MRKVIKLSRSGYEIVRPLEKKALNGFRLYLRKHGYPYRNWPGTVELRQIHYRFTGEFECRIISPHASGDAVLHFSDYPDLIRKAENILAMMNQAKSSTQALRRELDRDKQISEHTRWLEKESQQNERRILEERRNDKLAPSIMYAREYRQKYEQWEKSAHLQPFRIRG
jgi:hypothetical protein